MKRNPSGRLLCLLLSGILLLGCLHQLYDMLVQLAVS